MKSFKTIFNFELKNIFNMKSFRISTAILLAIMFIITFIPRFIPNSLEDFETDDEIVEIEENSEFLNHALYIEDSELISRVKENSILSQFNIYSDKEKMKEDFREGNLESAIIIKSLSEIDLLEEENIFGVNGLSSLVIEELKQIQKKELIDSENIDPNLIEKYDSIDVEVNMIGVDSIEETGSSFAISFAGLMILYTLIILYGSNVATSVAREKNDRTMELLITSTNPNSLIWGKVMANVVASILNIILMGLVIYLGYKINASYYPQELMSILLSNIDKTVLLVYLLFALMGTTLYFFLFAALGALVNKVEEVNSSIAPITFLIVISFLITNTFMTMPNALPMKIASFVPFSSPMSMFVRYSMTHISIKDIFISFSILTLSTYLMATLAIKIYRLGSLNYGNKMGFFKSIIKVLKRS